MLKSRAIAGGRDDLLDAAAGVPRDPPAQPSRRRLSACATGRGEHSGSRALAMWEQPSDLRGMLHRGSAGSVHSFRGAGAGAGAEEISAAVGLRAASQPQSLDPWSRSSTFTALVTLIEPTAGTGHLGPGSQDCAARSKPEEQHAVPYRLAVACHTLSCRLTLSLSLSSCNVAPLGGFCGVKPRVVGCVVGGWVQGEAEGRMGDGVGG
eukprot:1613555-Rhodomonas_salina.2